MKLKLVDVDNRLSTKYNKTDGIHNWGEDNAYPQLVKSIINSSSTAKKCVDISAKNIAGKGFEFVKDVTNKNLLIINKKGHTINQLLRIVATEFSYLNNFFLHINYNALYEITSVELLDGEDVRIGKTDSTGYAGKFIVYNNWDKSKGKKVDKKDFNIIDRFNPDPKIIDLQVEAAGGWNKYNGQVLHVNSTLTDLYSIPDADSILYEADTQFEARVLKNSGIKKGFHGTHLFITRQFKDSYERQDFEQTLVSTQGTSGILVLEADDTVTDLKEQMLVQSIDSNIKDDEFDKTIQAASSSIREAFGVPSILTSQDNDNSIFGNSGELLTQARLMFWDDNEEERNIIQETFEMLFSRFHQPINPSNNWNIIPLVSKPQPTNE